MAITLPKVLFCTNAEWRNARPEEVWDKKSEEKFCIFVHYIPSVVTVRQNCNSKRQQNAFKEKC
jgi:hypothetical protein